MNYKNFWFCCFILGIFIMLLGLIAPWWCEGHWSFSCTNSFGATWQQGDHSNSPLWVKKVESFITLIFQWGFVILVPLYLGVILWIEIKKRNQPKVIRNFLIVVVLTFTLIPLLNFNWIYQLYAGPYLNFMFHEPSFTLSSFFPLKFSPSIGFITLIFLLFLFFNELKSFYYSVMIRAVLLVSMFVVLIIQYLRTDWLVTNLAQNDSRIWSYHMAQGFWVAFTGLIFLLLLIFAKQFLESKDDYVSAKVDSELV